MKRTPTKTERDEHITRLRRLAHTIADCIEQDLPLEEWEQDFLRHILSNVSASEDPALTLRKWAASYEPGSSRGPYPKISDVDAAMAYVLYREKRVSHTAALELIAAEYKVSKQALLKTRIMDQVPNVCAHLGVDLKIATERKPLGRPRTQK